MADPITNFITDIPAKERKWKNHTITPFAKAWINAFENFKETMKQQKDADEAAQKLKFELAMLALSLCGGGLLTAAFGTAAAKTLATNAALDVICRNNMAARLQGRELRRHQPDRKLHRRESVGRGREARQRRSR